MLMQTEGKQNLLDILIDYYASPYFLCTARDRLKEFIRHMFPMQLEELIVYARPEDEFYNKHCTEFFTFATSRTVEKDELVPLRLVMLLTAEEIATAR